MKKEPARFSRYDCLPNAVTDAPLIPGCLVLEGGGWRGLYTQGVLDAMMEEDLNLSAVVGVSAGALSGFSYVAGQIGRSIHLNLHYRHDPNYFGRGAILKDHGVTGFSYLFGKMSEEWPLD